MQEGNISFWTWRSPIIWRLGSSSPILMEFYLTRCSLCCLLCSLSAKSSSTRGLAGRRTIWWAVPPIQSVCSHLHAASAVMVAGRLLSYTGNLLGECRSRFLPVLFCFPLFLVNKSRVLAWVIYLHTEVPGRVPNSTSSVNMNKPFGAE